MIKCHSENNRNQVDHGITKNIFLLFIQFKVLPLYCCSSNSQVGMLSNLKYILFSLKRNRFSHIFGVFFALDQGT